MFLNIASSQRSDTQAHLFITLTALYADPALSNNNLRANTTIITEYKILALLKFHHSIIILSSDSDNNNDSNVIFKSEITYNEESKAMLKEFINKKLREAEMKSTSNISNIFIKSEQEELF